MYVNASMHIAGNCCKLDAYGAVVPILGVLISGVHLHNILLTVLIIEVSLFQSVHNNRFDCRTICTIIALAQQVALQSGTTSF